MKIMVLGHESEFVNKLSNSILSLSKHNHKLVKLYFSDDTIIKAKNAEEGNSLNVKNFHDLTIEILEFTPDLIIYAPHPLAELKMPNYVEWGSILYDELILHLIDTIGIINCRLVYIVPFRNKSQFEDLSNIIQNGIEKLQQYPKTFVINQSEAGHDVSSLINQILE